MIETRTERSIVVFSNWAVFGFVGMGFVTEGFALDNYLVGLVGIAGIALGFVGHLVLNRVFDSGFTPGETALGLTLFGGVVLVFVLGWLFIGYSQQDFFIGLTLFCMLVAGFVIYLATRYGLRGAFSYFHFGNPNLPGPRR